MTVQTYPVSTRILAGRRAQAFTETGESYPIMFLAPIDLEIEDRCIVVTEDGRLLAIERNGEFIWKSIEPEAENEDRP